MPEITNPLTKLQEQNSLQGLIPPEPTIGELTNSKIADLFSAALKHSESLEILDQSDVKGLQADAIVFSITQLVQGKLAINIINALVQGNDITTSDAKHMIYTFCSSDEYLLPKMLTQLLESLGKVDGALDKMLNEGKISAEEYRLLTENRVAFDRMLASNKC